MRATGAVGFSVALMSVLLAGCDSLSRGGGERLYLAAVRPAQTPLPNGVRTIAVTPFVGQGPYGKVNAEMASGMLAARLNETIGPMGEGRYTIVDRSNLKQLLMEVDLGEAGITDSASAAQAGKILNADAVIFGTVHVMQSEERGTKSELDPLGMLGGGKPKTKTVQTIRRTCTVSMDYRMARPQTSEVILSKAASRNYDSGSESTHAGLFGSRETVSMDQVVRALTAQCVEDFLRMISPHVQVYEFQMGKGKGEQAKSAQALALGGEYAEAAGLFDQAFAADPDDHGSLYNRGLMKVMLGDFDAGRSDIVRAAGIKSDKKYTAALTALGDATAGGAVEIRPATAQEIAAHQQQARLDRKK